ncbi:MAG TPA: site-specific integrase, partial [Chitinophagaceae bacterium]|nr:site-specific integrase [Chitinophagaceae bacterium]
FNVRLNQVKTKIESAFRAYLNNNDQEYPDKDHLMKILDDLFQKSKKQNANRFLDYVTKFIEDAKTRLNPKTGKKISENTIKTYNTLLNHIKEFESKKQRTLKFKHLDLEFYADYTDFLVDEYKLSTNAIGKDIHILKAILNDSIEKGINKHTNFKSPRFKVLREESDSIYLTEKEIQELYLLDLSSSKTLEVVRDLFVIGCYTGQRYSDYTNIKPENITPNGDIRIKSVKTDQYITIPVLPIVKEILDKYDGKLPKAISNQKTNEYLKDIGKKVESLKAIVGKTITKAGKRIDLTKAKWELLTTHTARRSFATNHYLKKYPTLAIMAITGHKTEKAFLKYIKVGQSDQVQHFKKIAQSESTLKAV